MDISNPFHYVREECLILDVSLSQLCRKAGVARSTFYRWEHATPASILMLARLEDALRKARIADGRGAVDEVAAVIHSLKNDPVMQAAALARLDQLLLEIKTIYVFQPR